jgi:adenylate kinase
MQAVSSTLGSGAIKSVELSDVLHEEWVELLMLDLKIKTSAEFLGKSTEWHCPEGITSQTMKMLNEEFNTFRGLFPLKVFIGGPPVSGKTHFATKLARGYGIPHLMISDLIHEAQMANNDLGHEIKVKIDELKDIEIAAYEKTKKKKDPDLDRNTLKPRIPDSILYKIVKAKISSPACMNKGFILDGYPRKTEDATQIFMHAQDNAEIPADQ